MLQLIIGTGNTGIPSAEALLQKGLTTIGKIRKNEKEIPTVKSSMFAFLQQHGFGFTCSKGRKQCRIG